MIEIRPQVDLARRPVTQVILDTSPRALWPLDDGPALLRDMVGTKHGTPSGTYRTREPSRLGDGAVFLDGLTGIVTTGVFSLGNGPWSLGCWFRRGGTEDRFQGFLNSQTTASPGFGIQSSASNGGGSPHSVAAYSSNNNWAVDSGTIIVNDNGAAWHYCSCSKDASNTWKIHLDGVDVTVVRVSPTTSSDAQPIVIGDWPPGAGKYNGWLALGSVWDKILTLAEHRAIYMSGIGA